MDRKEEVNARRVTAVLAGIVALAAALRLVAIGRESLWFDEAVSYLAAGLPAPAILNNTVQSSHPPLYYLLLHGWRLVAPDGDAALRLPGVAWNLLTVPAAYWLTQALGGGTRPALFAGFLVAISPFHIFYSHELRMYTQLMFLGTMTVLAYWRARGSGRRAWWILFGLLSVAAIYTHLFAALVLAAVGLHALIHQEERAALWATVAVGAVVTVAFVPWLGLLAAESQTELGSLRPLTEAAPLNPVMPLTGLAFLIFGLSSQHPFMGLALFLTLSFVVIGGLEVYRLWRQGEADGLLLPLLVVLVAAGGPVAVYLARPFFLPERTLAAASPFLLALLAWGTTRPRSPLPYLAYGSAVVMLAGSVFYLTDERVKRPYREAMALVGAAYAPGDAVLHTSDGSYLPALRYLNLPAQAVLAGDPDPRKPDVVYQALGGQIWSQHEAGVAGERLWLVVALDHSVAWQQAQAADFAARYPALERHEVGGIQIILFDLSGNGS